MTNIFRNKHPFEDRLKESNRIKEKYAEKIPIIVTKSNKANSNISNIDKNKFLAPQELTIGQFLTVIRKRINIKDSESLFLFVNDNVLATTSSTLSTVYYEHKDEDGFLYITYCLENTFG